MHSPFSANPSGMEISPFSCRLKRSSRYNTVLCYFCSALAEELVDYVVRFCLPHAAAVTHPFLVPLFLQELIAKWVTFYSSTSTVYNVLG